MLTSNLQNSYIILIILYRVIVFYKSIRFHYGMCVFNSNETIIFILDLMTELTAKFFHLIYYYRLQFIGIPTLDIELFYIFSACGNYFCEQKLVIKHFNTTTSG